jgi:hypothetical protein
MRGRSAATSRSMPMSASSGQGPAGISVARELIGNGASVWLLESGGRDVERRVQRLYGGQSVGYPIHLPHQSRVRAFGGTNRH